MSRALITPLLAVGAVGAALFAPILEGPAPQGGPPPRPQSADAWVSSTAHPAPDVATAGLSVAVESDRRRVMPDDRSVQIKLTLSAPEAPPALRAEGQGVPTDLLLVLDRSGSMGGDKLLDLKAAAHELAGQLGDEDRLAIVSFGGSADLVRPLLSLDSSPHDAIEAMGAGGGTPMSQALQLSMDVWAEPVAGRARRTVLISDGLPDDPQPLVAQALILARSESPLTTVGIGMDYDETLMQGLADAGTGNFHWVQRGPQLASVLADELHTAQLTTASAVSVRIDGALGARIVSASGYPVRDGIVELGSLFAGQRRMLWLTVQLPPGLEPGLQQPGALEVRYSELSGAQQLASATLPPLELTHDTERFLAGIDRRGWEEAVVTEQYNSLRSEVSRLLQEGRAQEAMQSCDSFAAGNATLNQHLKSERVEDNLAQVARLKAELAAQEANPHHLQNAWAKETSQQAYRGRRRGQYLEQHGPK